MIFIKNLWIKALPAILICGIAFSPSIAQNSEQSPKPENYKSDSLKMLSLWKTYWRLDNEEKHDSCLKVCEQLISLGKDMGETTLDSILYEKYAKAYGGIGWNLMSLGQYEEGLKYSFKSYEKLRQRFGPNHKRISEVLVGISMNYLARGDYENALKYIYNSIDVVNEVFPEGHYYLANNENNLAHVYKQMGDYENAIIHLKKGLSFHEKQNRHTLSRTFFQLQIAECYLQIQEYDKALSLAQDALSYQKTYIKDSRGLTYAYFVLGSIFLEIGDYEAAERNLQKTIYLLPDIESEALDFNYGFIYAKLGDLNQRKGNHKASGEWYEKSIQYWNEYHGKGKRWVFSSYWELQNLYLKQNQLTKALEVVDEAMAVLIPDYAPESHFDSSRASGYTPNIDLLEASWRKGKALYAFSKKDTPIPYLLAAGHSFEWMGEILEKMQRGAHWENSRLELSKWQSRHAEGEIKTFLALNHVTQEEKYLHKAFESCEKNKAGLLVSGLAETAFRSFAGIPDSLIQKESSLREKISRFEKLIHDEQTSGSPNEAKVAAWSKELIDINNDFNALKARLRNDYSDYYEAVYSPQKITIDQIQKQLKPEECLIEYFSGDSSLYIFSITNTSLEVNSFPISKEFQQSYRTLRQQLHKHNPSLLSDQQKQEHYESFTQAASQLYEILLKPVIEQITPQQLIIIPDGYLGYIPFHLLLQRPASEGQIQQQDYKGLSYLFKQFPIQLEYSAALLFREDLKGRYSKAEISYAGFAPTYSGDELLANRNLDSLSLQRLFPEVARSGLNRLAFNRPEIEKAAEYFPGGKVFSAEFATESNFKQYGLEANILHLAMHGLTNDENPLFSQLVFTQSQSEEEEDGFLHAYELYNTQLKAELAVLSACNTGSGALAEGEGILSLARAFKYAGCPNIAMSLWKADDEATSQIMEGFFAQLKEGKGKSESLRLAQLDYLQNLASADKTHPYYWAPFVMIGDDEPLKFQRKGLPWWGWVLGGVGLLLVFVFRGKFGSPNLFGMPTVFEQPNEFG
jgi:CHAT domain-containing protein/tetratricopeptide (TPR) repeat protein